MAGDHGRLPQFVAKQRKGYESLVGERETVARDSRPDRNAEGANGRSSRAMVVPSPQRAFPSLGPP